MSFREIPINLIFKLKIDIAKYAKLWDVRKEDSSNFFEREMQTAAN